MNHIEQGYKSLDEGNFDQALEYFEFHLEKNNDPEGHLGIGITFRRMERFEQSHEAFDKGLTFFENHGELLGEKAVTFFQQNKIEDAIRLFEKAKNSEPANAFRYSSLAFAQAKAGLLFEAMDNYEKAIELEPDNEITHNNLGLLKEQMGWGQQAKVHFKKSDDLIGRTPTSSPLKEKKSEPKAEEKKKADKAGFFEVLGSVFTSKEERKGFFDFVKSKFNSEGNK